MRTHASGPSVVPPQVSQSLLAQANQARSFDELAALVEAANIRAGAAFIADEFQRCGGELALALFMGCAYLGAGARRFIDGEPESHEEYIRRITVMPQARPEGKG